MKKLTLLVATLLIFGISTGSFAQGAQQSTAPHAIKYQAIARNSNGELISNQNVSFRISILQGGEEGAVVYQETQTASTNQFGLANLSIGNGSVTSGAFDDIKWGNGTYFVKIEFDPKGGTDYTLMGTSQMLSVPYALYAEKAATIDNNPLQVALIATNIAQPVDNPETGLIVYNTGYSGTTPYDVSPGLYFNAGTPQEPNWVSLFSKHVTNANSTDRILALGSNNTTYGGATQDGACAGSGAANATSCPTGANNTGYGVGTFGGNASTNPTSDNNCAFGMNTMQYITSGSNNTALGQGALSYNTTGIQNVAVGTRALLGVMTNAINYNTAVGYQSLYSNNANYNTALGFEALYTNSSGTNNVGLGVSALGANTKGADNTAVGTNALVASTTADANIAIGYEALSTQSYSNSNTEWATNNVAIGVNALQDNQPTTNANGNENTAVGNYASNDNTTGGSNCAYGYDALQVNQTGNENTAMGTNALNKSKESGNTGTGYSVLYNDSLGAYNTATGFEALYKNGTAIDNTASGSYSLYSTTSGSFNTACGDSAGYNNTTGTKNTYMGYLANGSATLTDAAAVGYNAQVCSSDNMIFGDSNIVKWGFGLACGMCNSGVINVHTGPGTIISMNAAGIWAACSDRTKKTNFIVIDGQDILSKITALPITRWNYKWDSANVQHVGPMAQDFYKAFHLNNDSLHVTSVDEDGVALAGIQALNKKLEAENTALKAELAQVKNNQADYQKSLAELKQEVNSMMKEQVSIK